MKRPRDNFHLEPSKSCEWQTPPHIFEPLNAEFGFTLDAAADHGMSRCVNYICPEQDALKQNWPGVVWLNPPYDADQLAKFIPKAHAESRRGAIVVCLVPVKADQPWWCEFQPLATETRWIKGRVRFLDRDGRKRDSAKYPVCILIFRPPFFSTMRQTA